MTDVKMTQAVLAFNGAEIRAAGERLNLTDMWKATGSDLSRKPAEWLRSSDAARFVEFLAVTLGQSGAEVGNSHYGLVTVRRGGASRGDTEAHWQIGLAYAKYLSPEFHAWCNTVVRERMEGRSGDLAMVETIRRLDGMTKMLAHKVTEIERRVEAMGAMIDQMMERLPAIVGAMLEVVAKKYIETQLPTLVSKEFAVDPRIAAVACVPALKIAIDHKVPTKRRRILVKKIGDRLEAFCQQRDMVVSRDLRGTRLFPQEAVKPWLRAEGNAIIKRHIAAERGQGVLQFPGKTRRRGDDPAPQPGA